MPLSGDFDRSLSLQAMFAGISRDGIGATRAAMAETQKLTAECFEHESDPRGQMWAPLAPSTLKRRKPGPILGGILPDLTWRLTGLGRWLLRSNRKPYAVYHLGPDKRTGRPDRAFQPVHPGGMLAWGVRVHGALGRWLDDHRRRVRL